MRTSCVARTSTWSEAEDSLELDTIDDPALSRFQPAWATRAALIAATGERVAAIAAYEKAISLTTDIPTRTWLEARLAEVSR